MRMEKKQADGQGWMKRRGRENTWYQKTPPVLKSVNTVPKRVHQRVRYRQLGARQV